MNGIQPVSRSVSILVAVGAIKDNLHRFYHRYAPLQSRWWVQDPYLLIKCLGFNYHYLILDHVCLQLNNLYAIYRSFLCCILSNRYYAIYVASVGFDFLPVTTINEKYGVRYFLESEWKPSYSLGWDFITGLRPRMIRRQIRPDLRRATNYVVLKHPDEIAIGNKHYLCGEEVLHSSRYIQHALHVITAVRKELHFKLLCQENLGDRKGSPWSGGLRCNGSLDGTVFSP